MKRIFSFIVALGFGLGVVASAQQMPPIPVDPNVKIGKLDNGLTYYIRPNEEPKGQANFYIAQKVGSILEDESQRGLAHFLEHMCFNGTEHFPGNGVVYSNPDYSSTTVPLTINEGGSYSYYKIYMGDDLVRTVFISPNGAATVNLPAGTYRMNEAHGELWFGEDDMFGDDGSYYRCSFGGEETFELRSGYSYEISSSGEGTGIGNSPTDRESF